MADSDLLVPAGTRVVHIGFPKTGTTSLQSALEAARPGLPAHGVVYPGTERYHKNASIAAVGALVRIGETQPDRSHWDALVREVDRAGDQRVLISSEWFCEGGDDAAAEVVERLGGRGRVHIVVTLRPLAKILPSSWQQYLKNGLRVSYPDWLDGMLRKPPYEKPTASFWRRHQHGDVVNRWAGLVGPENLTAIIVDETDYDRILRQFEGLVGLPTGTLEQQPRVNASLTWPEAELVRTLNKAFRDNNWSDALYRRVIRQGVVDALMWRGGEPSGPSIPTPKWAMELAAERGDSIAKQIAASGVRVVGDLDALGRLPDKPMSNDIPPPVMSADVAALVVTAGINSTRRFTRAAERRASAADRMPPRWRRVAGSARARLRSLGSPGR